MLEKLYTRKVVIALMALILAANGLLLYGFQIKPPTQTANTPSSEGSPRIANAPRQQEEVEEPAEEEDGGEDKPESPEAGAPPQGSGGEEEPPAGEPPPQGVASPETPFESQYDPPPTVPGSESAAGSGDPSRIQVALASFYGSEGGTNGSSPDEASILPTTSGVVFLPAAMFIGAVAIGAVVIAALRRR